MVNYRCENCGYLTIYKSHFTDHTNRKKPCKKSYFCEECDFKSGTQNGLSVHLTTIHVKNTIVNNNIVNNTLNNTLNINNGFSPMVNGPLPFSKTDYSKIHEFISLMLNDKGYVDVVKFFELTHFNKNFPQNHNINIVDGRTKQLSILEENGVQKFLSPGLQGVIDLVKMSDKNIDNLSQLENEELQEVSTSLGEVYKETYNQKKKSYVIENLNPSVKEEICNDLKQTLHGIYQSSKKMENDKLLV